MDIASVMDREMLTIGQSIDKVISFVLQKFKNNHELDKKYKGIIAELIDLKEDPDYKDEEYKRFIKGYFFGHDNDLNQLK